MELVSLMTSGSVDDGKSTFIGRLLYETSNVPKDQWSAIDRLRLPDGTIDYSLLTDGLAAEREQHITIDVAYRYMNFKGRRYIIADVPGHEQYTKNMATAASRSDVALLLVDVAKGVSPQTKRHLFLSSVFSVSHLLILVNKMDQVEYGEESFRLIVEQVREAAGRLNIHDLQYIPISAKNGDMIVHRGQAMPWYDGRTVIDYLSSVEVVGNRNMVDFRFPVQYVIHGEGERRYAGTVGSGTIRVGEPVKILPSGEKSVIAGLFIGAQAVETAVSGQACAVAIADDRDIGRGGMIVREQNVPMAVNCVEVLLCWFDNRPLEVGRRYILKHTTRETFCTVSPPKYRIDMESFHREEVETLLMNDVGRVTISTLEPLFCDPYPINRATGSCILIDEETYETVGAAMIQQKGVLPVTPLVRSQAAVKSVPILWFTGLPGSGKTTIARALREVLMARGLKVEHLDGDDFRERFTSHLDFSSEGRQINLAVAFEVARLLSHHGIWVIASFISPFREQRDQFKALAGELIELYVSAPPEVCESRDPKGMYRLAREGQIQQFTGVSDPYEPPFNPALLLDTAGQTVQECVDKVMDYLKHKNLICLVSNF